MKTVDYLKTVAEWSCAVRLLYKEEFDMFDDGYNTAAEYLSDHEDTQSETTTPTDLLLHGGRSQWNWLA